MGIKSLSRIANEFLALTKVANKPSEESKPLILCVEDDRDTLELLRVMLDSRGYEILTADTVEKALHLASLHKNIHTLVTDYHINGRTATDLIQALGPNRPKNVVLLSGKHFAGDPRHEVPGIDSHVHKPFKLKHLIEKIDVKPDPVTPLT